MEYIVSIIATLAEFISFNNISDCFLDKLSDEKNKLLHFYLTFFILTFTIFLLGDYNFLKLIIIFSTYLVFLQVRYKGAFIKKVSLVVITLVLIYAIDYIMLFFSISFFKISPEKALSTPSFFIFGALISKLILLFLTYTIKKLRKESKEKSEISNLEWLQILTVPSCSLFTLFLLMNTALQNNTTNIWLTIDALAIILSNIVLFLIISKLEKDRNIQQQYKILEQQVKIEMDNITSLVETYAEQRKLTHDYNNHLDILQELVAKEKFADAKNYLESLLETKKSMPIEINSGNAIIDAMITQKYILAQNSDIDFQVSISDLSEISIKNEDLVVILANLLDNAIEAAKASGKKRIIKIKLLKELDEIVLSIQNTVNGNLFIKEEIGHTSKKDKLNHGYGLKNVDSMVKKYDGYYSIFQENEWFKISVVLPK